jgi:hypothetical protein
VFDIMRQSKPITGTSWEKDGKTSCIITVDTEAEAIALLADIEAHRKPRPGRFRFTGIRYWIQESNTRISSTRLIESGKPEYSALLI